MVAALGLVAAAPAAAQSGRSEIDWSLCRPNALLEFYVPGLPTDVERESAPTDFDAASVTAVDQKRYTLEGDVVVTRADQRLAADTLSYDQESGTVEATGEVRYQDKDVLLAAKSAKTNLETDRTELGQVRYQLLAARGNGEAAAARREGEVRTELDQVTFSTCDPGDHDWEISAREIELDHESGTGRARGMKLRFQGVPLLALPYATFPIDDRRRSGFLYPQIGGSNNGGFDLLLPYYLNLAPNYDATLTPRIITDRGLMLGGEFRYLTRTQRGEIGFTWLPGDDQANRDRWSYRADHVGTFGRHFYVVADLNRVSDDRYFEDFGDSLTAAATSLLPSTAYLYGRGEWWNLAFGGDDYTITDPSLAAGAEPYRRLPRLTFDAEKPLFEHFAVGLRSELVAFDKDNATTGNRYDLTPYVAFPFERAAGFVRPELAWRHTGYQLDNVLGDDAPSRSTTIASVDAGLYFDRNARFGERRLRQTLEPRIYYLHVPFENQDDLPIFDTQETTFSFAQLFRPNRFTGADRQMDANQLTLAVTSRLLDDTDGRELLRGSIGQIRYFDDQDVQLPGVAPTDFSGSAYAAELALNMTPRWSLVASQQYDPEREYTTLSALRVQHRFGEDGRGVANVGYRYRRGVLEQVDASAAFPVSPRVRLVGRWNYSLKDEATLEAFGGVEFESCCYAFRVLGRHYVRNVEGDTSNAIYLELELKGLGSIGRRSEDFLRRSIIGYR